MPRPLLPRPAGLRGRIALLASVLLLGNLTAWAWALLASRSHPVLLGTAALAFGLGLRHAMDADHIAAIDNVTRSLMRGGGRPVGVGFFFALGHSAVVALAVAGLAGFAAVLSGPSDGLRGAADLVGTAVSALFLFAMAATNLLSVRSLWRRLRTPGVAARPGAAPHDDASAAAPGRPAQDGPAQDGPGGGVLSWLLRPVFRLVTRSWHMLAVGFLFGLGFDTATEVALLGLSATEAAHGLPVLAVLVLPALFASGMALADTADGLLMLGAYGWAAEGSPGRLACNLVFTLASVLVAVLVGGVETLGLLGERLSLQGRFWDALGQLNDHAVAAGLAVTALFAVAWLAGAVALRRRAVRS